MTREERLQEMIGYELEFVSELFDTEEEVIVSKQEGRQEDYQIYEDSYNSEIYCAIVENGIIVKAW